jgi:hypothetical protein
MFQLGFRHSKKLKDSVFLRVFFNGSHYIL